MKRSQLIPYPKFSTVERDNMLPPPVKDMIIENGTKEYQEIFDGSKWIVHVESHADIPFKTVNVQIINDIAGFNETIDVTLIGDYFSSETKVSIEGSNTVNSVTFVDAHTLVVNITAGNVAGKYDLTLYTVSELVLVDAISVLDITIVIPKLTGSAQETWIKSGSSNGCILTTGGYEAENTSGDGWNEYAYFGGFTSASKIMYAFDVTRLNGASNAYGHIKFDTPHSTGTSGNPQIYISGGNSLAVYDPDGTSTTYGVAVNDKIRVELTPTSYTIYKNDAVLHSWSGAVDLTDIYMTFVSYRVLKIENIKVSIFN